MLSVRLTVRKLTNSGTAWAGLVIACGWLVRRPVPAAAARIVGSLLSLAAHYSLGRLLGTFDATIWSEKSSWFVAALIFGAPLGLVSALARRTNVWVLASRLVIPFEGFRASQRPSERDYVQKFLRDPRPDQTHGNDSA